MPSPLPSRTLTSCPSVAVARSRLPSLLKSPTASDAGSDAGGEVARGAEPALAVTQQHADGAAVAVRRGQVEIAVVVEVGRRHGLGIRADGVTHAGHEAQQAAVFQGFEVGPMRRGSSGAALVIALAPAWRRAERRFCSQL